MEAHLESSVEINDPVHVSYIEPPSLLNGNPDTETHKWNLCMMVYATVILMMYCVAFSASLFLYIETSKDISRTADYINKSLALIEMHLESIQVKA